MNDDLKDEILKDATRIAGDLPEEQRQAFIADYLHCSKTINDCIDARLDNFQRAAAEVIEPILQGRPAVVEHILNLHSVAIRDITARFVFATSRIGDPGLRKLLSDALHEVFATAMTALSEMDSKNVTREGKEGSLQ